MADVGALIVNASSSCNAPSAVSNYMLRPWHRTSSTTAPQSWVAGIASEILHTVTVSDSSAPRLCEVFGIASATIARRFSESGGPMTNPHRMRAYDMCPGIGRLDVHCMRRAPAELAWCAVGTGHTNLDNSNPITRHAPVFVRVFPCRNTTAGPGSVRR